MVFISLSKLLRKHRILPKFWGDSCTSTFCPQHLPCATSSSVWPEWGPELAAPKPGRVWQWRSITRPLGELCLALQSWRTAAVLLGVRCSWTCGVCGLPGALALCSATGQVLWGDGGRGEIFCGGFSVSPAAWVSEANRRAVTGGIVAGRQERLGKGPGDAAWLQLSRRTTSWHCELQRAVG